jgi:hypothetical protein
MNLRCTHPSRAMGETFGRLTVIAELADRDSHGNRLFRCRCSCGNERVLRASPLRKGRVLSCGCLNREKINKACTTHGKYKTPTWYSWQSMLSRCRSPKSPGYKYYGGRGIAVCDRWLKFENFFADMGERPDGLTLDRYPDNDGNYEPGNCRWATPLEQIHNRRAPIFVPKTHCPKGHAYIEGSFTLSNRGDKRCRQCRQEEYRSARTMGIR